MKTISPTRESFEKMITNNNYYVDKTQFIKTVITPGHGKVLYITRPRRFGKTLTLSTLYEFLRINPKDPNNPDDTSYQEALFKDTKIIEDKEFCQNYMGKFPVIFITLKSVEGNTFEDALNALVSVILTLFNSKFSYLFQSEKLDNYYIQQLLKTRDPIYYSSGLYKSDIHLSKYDLKERDS